MVILSNYPHYIIQLGQSAKKRAFLLISQLTSAGIAVQSSLSRDTLKSQLKMANRARAKYAIILGQRELLDKCVIIKDMKTGSQETVAMKNYLLKIQGECNEKLS